MRMKNKSLTISIIGKPNSGKSALLNYILGNKFCIVSPRAHSTREAVLGVFNVENTQLIFTDTPGLSVIRKKDFMFLSNITEKILSNNDLAILVIDACDDRPSRFPHHIIRIVNKAKVPLIVFLNKVDISGTRKLLPLTEHLVQLGVKQIFSGSAITGKGINTLINYLVSQAKPQDWFFDENFKTSRSINDRMKDRIKEVLFAILDKEIPYQLDIELQEKENKTEVIIRSPACYKHIILGHIKEISIKSRERLSAFLNKKLNLYIQCYFKD